MANELRILILEDIEEDAGLIDRALKKENIVFTRLRVDTRDSFIEALDNYNPDIILSDHSLPQFNSIEALEIFKSRAMDIPFILVTGAVSEEFAVNCLKRGADDYILKSNLSRLPMAMEQASRQHQNERNRAQQEERVRIQNEELVKINKELDSFVYSISHNLRSPLSSVLGLVNVAKLEDEKSPETVAQYFSMIEGSITKLDHTLREILDYSQNTRTEIELTELALEKLVWECIEQSKYIKGYSAIIKEVTVTQDVPFYSDGHRLNIVLSNLISNSVHYADKTKKRQQITIKATVNPAYATITVHDNGIGIATSQLPKIFNMFFRATERSEGAGLGLYIVKEMIEKLKGTIVISSTAFESTLATMTIPNHLIKV